MFSDLFSSESSAVASAGDLRGESGAAGESGVVGSLGM